MESMKISILAGNRVKYNYAQKTSFKQSIAKILRKWYNFLIFS